MADRSLEIRYLSGHDVTAIGLTDAEVLAAVEGALRAQGRGEVVLEPRVHLVPDESFNGHFNVLRAYIAPLSVAGVKVVGDYVDNYRVRLPSELATLTLYDPRTGVPVAIMDATEITERRTGAVTAIGAKYLARPDSKVLGHVGARGTAFSNVVMLDSLFDFEEIRVTSRRDESRRDFGERLALTLGQKVRVVGTVEEAVRGADVVVEATRLVQPSPIVLTRWIAPGALVVPYGTMSAVELSLTDVMNKIVVDDWAQCRSGQFGALRAHVEAGLLDEKKLHAELGQIVAGERPGRTSDDERILFWHRGLATTDVAVGHLLYQRALERNIGVTLPYR
jgi:ornithine cyclodeaminase